MWRRCVPGGAGPCEFTRSRSTQCVGVPLNDCACAGCCFRRHRRRCPPPQATTALTTLCALLEADTGSTGLADALYRATSLPARALEDLQESPYRALTQV